MVVSPQALIEAKADKVAKHAKTVAITSMFQRVAKPGAAAETGHVGCGADATTLVPSKEGTRSTAQDSKWRSELVPFQYRCKKADLTSIMKNVVVTKAADYSGNTKEDPLQENERHVRLLVVVALFDMVIQVR